MFFRSKEPLTFQRFHHTDFKAFSPASPSIMSLTETLPKNSGTNVQVAVRCRPMNAEERKNNAATVVTCDMENKSIKVATGPVGKKIMKSFVFDKVRCPCLLLFAACEGLRGALGDLAASPPSRPL